MWVRALTKARPNASAEFLGQRDDDALGAADVAGPIDVVVLRHLANEFGAWACRRARVSSMSSTAKMLRRVPSVFAAAFGSALTVVGVWNFVSSSRLWPSGVRIIATSTRTLSSPTTSPPNVPQLALALQLQAKFDKERGSSLEVVENHADVVHPLDRHVRS